MTPPRTSADAGIAPLAEGAAPHVLSLWSADPEALGRALREAGISYQRFGHQQWPDLDLQAFPHSRELALERVQVPLHQSLRQADLERIRDAIRGAA